MSGELRLSAGELSAVFLPGQGMLGASLRHRGSELLGQVGDVPAMAAAGRTCGIPLLYPWANRLAVPRYSAAGRDVALDSPLLGHDRNGLPNHGVPWPRLAWTVLASTQETASAELRWDDPDRLAVFPYRHRVVMDLALDEAALSVTTRVDATDDVPISFGFHPYFTLPGVAREQWDVSFPAMRELLTDAVQIPTGESVEAAPVVGPLGDRTFDDGYALTGSGDFVVSGGGRTITVRMGAGYTHAQLFAPPGKDFIAIEPMTAAVNALVSGSGLRVAPAGTSFTASFRIEVR
jgi:galactose mutarotase-like enzyme